MRRVLGIGAAWLAATLVAVFVAAAAVGSVRSEVADAPTALGAQPSVTLASSDGDVGGTTEAPDPVEVVSPSTTAPEVEDSTTTTTEVESTSTTTVASSTSSPTTTEPSQTTTSTEPPPTTQPSYTKTFNVDGAGTVTVRVSGESVTFAGAQVSTGWTIDVKDRGPEHVEVKFERNDEHESLEFKAEVEDGELKAKVSEKD